MGELRTVLMEGIFYEGDEDLLVQTEQHSSPVRVREALAPMIDQEVHLAAHHFPAEPLDENRWGGGCCMWESAGKCPAGHHKDPTYLFNVVMNGVLCYDPVLGWSVGGEPLDITPLAGHRSRIVVVVKFNLDKMRESFGSVDPSDLEQLGAKALQMRVMLSQVRGFLKDMKGE